jgi:hypothetical protein
MVEYDGSGTPMWRSFNSTADLRHFNSIRDNIDLNDMNTARNELEKKSAGFDFTAEDRVPDNEFNEVLWKGIKGLNVKVPPPRRAAFVKSHESEEEKD